MIRELIESLEDTFPEVKSFGNVLHKHEGEIRTAFGIHDRILNPPIFLPKSVVTKMPGQKDIEEFMEEGLEKENATGAVNMLITLQCYEFFEEEIQKMLRE